ncbi:MAG: hypothetical protein ABW122_13615 [Ilumatobacteraceae bacterium]
MNTKTWAVGSLVATIATAVLVAGAITSAKASTPAPRTVTAAATVPKGKLKITNPTQRVVGWSGSVRVTPLVKKGSGVKVVSKRIDVYRASKLHQADRPAVQLRPGAYRLVIKVKSKTKGRTSTTRRSMRLVVRQNACATSPDVRALKVDAAFSPSVQGTSVAQAQRLMRSPGVLERVDVSGVLQHSARLTELYADDPNVMAQANAELAPLRRLAAKGVRSIQEREFAACGVATRYVGVFAEGELVQLKRL